MDEELKTRLYWGFCILMSVIAIFSFYSSNKLDKEKENMTYKTSELEDVYVVDIKSGPSPYIVDLLNVRTKEKSVDVQLFQTCPKYNMVVSGIQVQLKKETSYKISNGEKIEKFTGGYNELCKNKPVVIKKEDAK